MKIIIGLSSISSRNDFLGSRCELINQGQFSHYVTSSICSVYGIVYFDVVAKFYQDRVHAF